MNKENVTWASLRKDIKEYLNGVLYLWKLVYRIPSVLIYRKRNKLLLLSIFLGIISTIILQIITIDSIFKILPLIIFSAIYLMNLIINLIFRMYYSYKFISDFIYLFNIPISKYKVFSIFFLYYSKNLIMGYLSILIIIRMLCINETLNLIYLYSLIVAILFSIFLLLSIVNDD